MGGQEPCQRRSGTRPQTCCQCKILLDCGDFPASYHISNVSVELNLFKFIKWAVRVVVADPSKKLFKDTNLDEYLYRLCVCNVTDGD